MKTNRGRWGLLSGSSCLALLMILGTSRLSAGAQSANSPRVAAAVGSQSAAASQEVAAFARALAGVTGYSATVTIFGQKGAQTQNVVFDYTFREPSNVTVAVVAGPNAGVTLTWDGGSTVVARRGSGIAAMFSRTLSLHDPLVTTLNGASIDQLSFDAILAHVQQEPGTLSVAHAETINGVAVNAVTLIPSTAASNAGLTREVLELSAETHLPLRLLGYEGTTLVRQIDLSNVKLQGSS